MYSGRGSYIEEGDHVKESGSGILPLCTSILIHSHPLSSLEPQLFI